MDLIWADFWFKFPNLRFSLTEGDIGWIPYFLERAEHVNTRHSGWTGQHFPDSVSGPAEVFRMHILCCFISDPVGIALLERNELMHPDDDRSVQYFNLDNVCWELDYPHSDSPWPYAPETVARIMANLPDEQVAKITHLNAMAHYQFDPFKTRRKEDSTVGALRSLAQDVDLVTHGGRLADERDAQRYQGMKAAQRERAARVYGASQN
jgi:hypothetical protein